MGIFGQSTPFDADIEKATSEKNTNEDWTLILDVCDKVTSNPRNAKECLKAIMKRMGHADPHVVIQAVTLLDACCNNCGKPFHLEVASREFENEFRRLLSKAQPQVSLKMRQLLKSWAENDFKNDPQLNLIPSLYQKLKSEGYDFSDNPQKSSKVAPSAAALKDPNVVSSQQEEEDIAKAIELSLKETKNSPKKQGTSAATGNFPSLYPSFSGSSGSGSVGSLTTATSITSQSEPRKVRALYDFEAAEENELTFTAGEIIHVIDDSDPNWWKGYNQRGEGLFPSNFVTADLSVEPERFDINQKAKKTVQFEDESNAKTEDQKTEEQNYVVEIDEQKIDRLLNLLHEANPEDASQDTEEMLRLEQEVHQMGPLIDAELERVDRKHAQLTQLSSDLVDAINLYHTLMRDDRTATFPSANFMQPMGYNSQQMYAPGPFPYMSQAPQSHQQNYHMPQGFPPMSMPSLQQSTAPPTASAPDQMRSLTSSGSVPGNVNQMMFNPHMQISAPQPVQQPQMIPPQFQNGRLNTPQQNGHSAPTSVNNSLQSTSAQQYQTQSQTTQSFPSQSLAGQHQPQQQSQSQTMATHQIMAHHPQQQQPQLQPQHHPTALPPNGPIPNPGPGQAPSQFISQQQFLMRQYPIPNGAGTFIPSTLPTTNAAAPPLELMCNPQIAAGLMSSGISHQMTINPPVSQNFLVQRDAKTNIPVFQQQR